MAKCFNFKGFLCEMVLSILLISLNSCQNFPSEGSGAKTEFEVFRYKSIHLFARREIDSAEIQKLKSLNINSIVLVPFMYQRGLNTDTVIVPEINSYEWTERDEGIIGMARICNENDLKLILKPHVWPIGVENGEWRESIMPDENNWSGWSNSYEQAMLHYAEICVKEKIAMLCIGAELKLLALEKPEYWRSLIKKIRSVYSGDLTYAANWYQEYEEISFWDDLDYIGIQAYFPIASKDSSGIEYMKSQWTEHCEEIFKISEKYNKPVLITEMGYKSSINAGVEPWLWDEHWRAKGPNIRASEEMQVQCYKAFFETTWKKEWCAGTFIWNWKSPYDKYGGPQSSTFTPQRKKSEEIIRYYFQ